MQKKQSTHNGNTENYQNRQKFVESICSFGFSLHKRKKIIGLLSLWGDFNRSCTLIIFCLVGSSYTLCVIEKLPFSIPSFPPLPCVVLISFVLLFMILYKGFPTFNSRLATSSFPFTAAPISFSIYRCSLTASDIFFIFCLKK